MHRRIFSVSLDDLISVSLVKHLKNYAE